MLSDLLSYELDPRVKRGAELSMEEKRVVNSIHWQIGSWKDLVVQIGGRLEWTMFSTSPVNVACCGTLQTRWWTPEVRDAVWLKNNPVELRWLWGVLRQLMGTSRPDVQQIWKPQK